MYGKNFAAIAEFLERKSVKDCVWYYYLTKYRLNYKQKIKKRKKAFKNYRAPVMPRFEEIAQNITQEVNDVVGKIFFWTFLNFLEIILQVFFSHFT